MICIKEKIVLVEKRQAKDLLQAAAEGNLSDLKNNLAAGEDIDHINNYQFLGQGFYGSAIKMAALGKQLDIVKFLLEKGANPFLPYDKELIPKIVMDFNRPKHIADYLFWAMKQPKILNGFYEDGFTPLGYCISKGHHQRVQELIEMGADVCKMDKNKKTPLIYAIEVNSTEIVHNLTSNGALACGVSALEAALNASKDEIVEILLKNKPELANATCKMALHLLQNL